MLVNPFTSIRRQPSHFNSHAVGRFRHDHSSKCSLFTASRSSFGHFKTLPLSLALNMIIVTIPSPYDGASPINLRLMASSRNRLVGQGYQSCEWIFHRDRRRIGSDEVYSSGVSFAVETCASVQSPKHPNCPQTLYSALLPPSIQSHIPCPPSLS